jgi:predicted AAA+ superfamily ATPase
VVEGAEVPEEDPDVVKWREMPVRSVPAEIEEISLEPFSLNFLYGPRQVGKTTLVKLLVLRLLERVEPEAVFYFSCDPLSDYEELLEVLREYLRARRLGQPSYVFLDEVTFVREWYRAVKHLIDAGRLRSSVVTVTGSSSLWVERAAETFPGRRGTSGSGQSRGVRAIGVEEYLAERERDHARRR